MESGNATSGEKGSVWGYDDDNTVNPDWNSIAREGVVYKLVKIEGGLDVITIDTEDYQKLIDERDSLRLENSMLEYAVHRAEKTAAEKILERMKERRIKLYRQT